MNTPRYALTAGAVLLAMQSGVDLAIAQDRELRDVGEFDAISVGGGVDVHLMQGEEFRVEVDADDADQVVTRVRGDTLEIQPQRSGSFFGNLFRWGDAGDVYVTLPRLHSLAAGGGSDVDSAGTLSGDTLEINASGGSDVSVDVAVTNLEVNASGGSDVSLSGSAELVRVRSSGGSDFDARDLAAVEADLQSSGGSDVTISVSQRLVARASGGSDIVYSGEPSEVDVDASGGADIRRR